MAADFDANRVASEVADYVEKCHRFYDALSKRQAMMAAVLVALEDAPEVPALVAEVEELRAERKGLAAAIRALLVEWTIDDGTPALFAPVFLDRVAEPHRSLLRAILDKEVDRGRRPEPR